MTPIVVVAAAVLVVMGLAGNLRELGRQLEEALNNWRGGPPPTHPMPADDGVIVLRRRPKTRS
jgi:hypothetical protein